MELSKKVYLIKNVDTSNYKIGVSSNPNKRLKQLQISKIIQYLYLNNNMKDVYIYTLSDSKGIRYVGKTNNIKRRYENHISEVNNKKLNNKRINWIKSLINNNSKPIIDVIDIVPSNEWVFWEKFWISIIKSWGFNLVNGTTGGENPPSFKGRTHSDKYKEIRRNIMKKNNPAKNMNDIWRNKISQGNKGRKFSKEHIKNLSKSINQYNLNDEFIREWESITKASNELNICYNSISLCCRNKRKKGGGFKWSFKK